MLQTAKLFTNGSSQAVRLPKEFRFQGTEVYVQKVGGCLLISPKDRAWETFMEGVSGFTDDYFEAIESNRAKYIPSEREALLSICLTRTSVSMLKKAYRLFCGIFRLIGRKVLRSQQSRLPSWSMV